MSKSKSVGGASRDSSSGASSVFCFGKSFVFCAFTLAGENNPVRITAVSIAFKVRALLTFISGCFFESFRIALSTACFFSSFPE